MDEEPRRAQGFTQKPGVAESCLLFLDIFTENGFRMF